MELKTIRKKKNLSQFAVARKAGISRGSYANIESGKRRPSPEVAQRLGECLGFDWTIFYTANKHRKAAQKAV